MSTYRIKRLPTLPEFNVVAEKTVVPEEPKAEFGYNSSLNQYRDFIDNIDSDIWKKVRWYINEFDFLVKDPIINRAFYKYWEIINEFELFEDYSEENRDLVLHCAEAPGGFIQGTNIYLQIDRIPVDSCVPTPKQVQDDDGFITIQKRKRRPKVDYRIFTISLNKDLPQYKSYNLPSYNKNIINKHICITYGKDETGDINNWENIHHIEKLSSQPFYLITADGGFDEGTEFNNKEQLHYGLILSEIYSALYLQKPGGHFVLKVFDVFTETSIHLLYLLSFSYGEMYVYKPKTSRPTNSEKYIICKNFILEPNQKLRILSRLQHVSNAIRKLKCKYVSVRLFQDIPAEFVEDVRAMNSELLQKQCKFLQQAVDLCKDENFLDTYDQQLSECIEKENKCFINGNKFTTCVLMCEKL
jgi:23S rRNA U2552 (ribose-2'-O)-methylase RlmE/FtsJ